MITRIELTNFMSHKHTVIEPAAGLTVLVGPNNAGKSAVVTALQILCHNENSTYVLRHGERECTVTVQTDNGHIIQWQRKNAPSYIIDDQTFDRLRGSGLPDELHQALKLPRVDAAGDVDFDIHFGTQKAPIFLLGSSAANAARFFASSSDAIRLVTIQKRHKKKLYDAQREKTRLEAESRQLNAELERLEPVVNVDRRLEKAESVYAELKQLKIWLGEAEKHEGALVAQAAVLVQSLAFTGALSTLAPPPTLVHTEPLEDLIAAVETEEGKQEAAESRIDALVRLSPLPELAATEPLTELIVAIETSESYERAASSRADSLASLSSPPSMHDVASLARMIKDLDTLTGSVERDESKYRSFFPLSSPPQLADSDSLQTLDKRLTSCMREVALAKHRDVAMEAVLPPPELSNETELSGLLSSIVQTTAQSDSWEKKSALLAKATLPQIPAEIGGIKELIAQLEQAVGHVWWCKTESEAAEHDFTAAAAELRERAAGSLCPICGNALDPDRVVACAVGGGAGGEGRPGRFDGGPEGRVGRP